MSAAPKKAEYGQDIGKKTSGFPKDAFRYDDDVSQEAVETLRKKAAAKIGADDWIRVDGFGKPFES